MSDLTIERLEHFKKVMEPTPPFLDALIAEKRAHAKLRAELADLMDVYALMSTDSFTPRAEQVLYENCATDLTRILEATDD